MAGELFLPRGQSNDDESLGAFVRRRFGSEALERVAQPLIGGIYASDPTKLSLAATMPRFKEMERQQRSVILAMWSDQRRRARNREAGSGARWSLFVTLAGGMQELVDTLAKRLPESTLRLNAPVTRLSCAEDEKNWRITIAGNETIHSRCRDPRHARVSDRQILLCRCARMPHSELKQISYASTATVSLAYRREDFPRAPDSFGFVVPAIEQRKIMACTFSSLKYPGRAPEGKVLLRAFVGGALQPELFGADDATMEKNVRDELASLLGVSAPPIFARIWRHPDSMPQYHVGHETLIKRIEASLSQFSTLALAGSAYHGVGISDCVRTGEEAAEKVMGYLIRLVGCACAPLPTGSVELRSVVRKRTLRSLCHFDAFNSSRVNSGRNLSP